MNNTDDDDIPTGEHPALDGVYPPKLRQLGPGLDRFIAETDLKIEEARQKQENTTRGLASTLQGAALAISLIDPLTLATHEFPRMYSPVRSVQTPEEVERALKDAADRRAKKNERRAQRHGKK